jgi:hypothetical protein
MDGVEFTDESGNLLEIGPIYEFTFTFIIEEKESLKYINSFPKNTECNFKVKQCKNVCFGGTCEVQEVTYLNNVVNITVLTKTVSSTKAF